MICYNTQCQCRSTTVLVLALWRSLFPRCLMMTLEQAGLVFALGHQVEYVLSTNFLGKKRGKPNPLSALCNIFSYTLVFTIPLSNTLNIYKLRIVTLKSVRYISQNDSNNKAELKCEHPKKLSPFSKTSAALDHKNKKETAEAAKESKEQTPK